jgi:glycine cleavage system H lipoate-binding protein
MEIEVYKDKELITDAIGAVESVKAASDIYAPCAGIVEEINEALNDQPSLLNKKPESDGELQFSQTHVCDPLAMVSSHQNAISGRTRSSGRVRFRTDD